MTFLKSNLVAILFALGGVGWLVQTLKQIIKGEPLTATPLVTACMFFTFAIVFGVAIRRKSGGDSGPPKA